MRQSQRSGRSTTDHTMAERASADNRKDLKVKGGQRTVKCPAEATMAEGVEEWGERSAGTVRVYNQHKQSK